MTAGLSKRVYLRMEVDVPTILSKTKIIPEIKIRSTVPGDEIALGRLYAEAYFELMDQLPPPRSKTLEDFTEMMTRLFIEASKENHKDIFKWIAECSEYAVGFLITKVIQDFGYVGEIGVPPPHRRKGIAQALLREFASFLRGKGIQKIKLDVNVKNIPAIGFFESCTKFIHKKALKYKAPSIEVKVINQAFGDLNSDGTTIHGALSNNIIVETAFPSPAIAVTIVGEAISESPQILQEVFQEVKKAEASILGVSINHNSLILYLPEKSAKELLEALHSIVVSHKETLALAVRKNLAFIRIKGVGLEETPGIISRLAESLYSGGINIFGIFTITSSVSVFVDLKDKDKALRLMQKSIKANRGKINVN